MPVKHRLKGRRTECTVSHRRTVEVVDLHTSTTHFMTMDAMAAGRLPKGRYITLCGQDVLPASMAEPGQSRCASCVAIPAQRARA